MIKEELKKELEYVERNLDRFRRKYPMKYILVHNNRVIENFDDYSEAVNKGIKLYGEDGLFLIHYIDVQEQTNFIFEAAV